MSQTNKDAMNDYKSKHIANKKVEWLIEKGRTAENVFFKGATGDRYSIYVFIKRNKNVVDIYSVYNMYSHDTDEGNYLGSIKDYKLHITGERKYSWRNNSGEVLKQLSRQGVCPLARYAYKIRFCRSAYMIKTYDGNEFTPWLGMKMNLKTGLLAIKPTRKSVKAYKIAKNQDSAARKRNYIANRENTKALERYRKAGGDTESARGGFRNGKWTQPEVGVGLEKINWDMIPLDDVFRHRNATLRSNIIEHYGMNAILATLKHEVVDEETIDGRLYKLLDVTIPDFSNNRADLGNYKGLYLEMLNPSTGESHFEGIPNADERGWGDSLKEATVKAALTWRDNDISIQSGNKWNRTNPVSSQYIKPVILK